MERTDEGGNEHALARFVDELAELAEQGEVLKTSGPISDPLRDFFAPKAG